MVYVWYYSTKVVYTCIDCMNCMCDMPMALWRNHQPWHGLLKPRGSLSLSILAFASNHSKRIRNISKCLLTTASFFITTAHLFIVFCGSLSHVSTSPTATFAIAECMVFVINVCRWPKPQSIFNKKSFVQNSMIYEQGNETLNTSKVV